MQRITTDHLVSENDKAHSNALVLPKFEFEENYILLENLCRALVRSTDAGSELYRRHVVKGET